jgi:hypothetical protein
MIGKAANVVIHAGPFAASNLSFKFNNQQSAKQRTPLSQRPIGNQKIL